MSIDMFEKMVDADHEEGLKMNAELDKHQEKIDEIKGVAEKSKIEPTEQILKSVKGSGTESEPVEKREKALSKKETFETFMTIDLADLFATYPELGKEDFTKTLRLAGMNWEANQHAGFNEECDTEMNLNISKKRKSYTKEKIEIVLLYAAELRVKNNYSIEEILKRAEELNLDILSPEMAIYLRLAYRNQPSVPENIFIGMQPVTISSGDCYGHQVILNLKSSGYVKECPSIGAYLTEHITAEDPFVFIRRDR